MTRNLKKIITLLVPFFSFTSIIAQQKPIEVIYERKDDNSIEFKYIKKILGSYHLTINFTQIQNARDPHFSRSINGVSGNLFTLRPDTPNQGIGFSFDYNYIRGKLNPKVDRDFVYLIPFGKNKKIRTGGLTYLTGVYGNTPPKDWKAIQFLANSNDTVYAARKGIVVELIDKYDKDNKVGYTFKDKVNEVLIEHKDGTFARYAVLEKGSFMVKKGETVYPRTPLALAGTYDSPENSQLRFMVYYLHNDKKKKGPETMQNRTHFNAYINPKFYTEKGEMTLNDHSEYLVDYTEDMIVEEMTKREKKKRTK